MAWVAARARPPGPARYAPPMHDRLRLLPALAPLLIGGCSEGGPGPRLLRTPSANVLLVVIDTLRGDHLSCYGHERVTSPQLDRFAEDSWVYERAYSQAPWTTPSIGALLTSRYPTSLGIRGDRSVLPEEEITLAETLQGAGYHTAAVVSHSFCSERWGFAQVHRLRREQRAGTRRGDERRSHRARARVPGES